jgi:hypothetical protein
LFQAGGNRQFNQARFILNQVFLKQAGSQINLSQWDAIGPVPHRTGEARYREGDPHAFDTHSPIPQMVEPAGLCSPKNPPFDRGDLCESTLQETDDGQFGKQPPVANPYSQSKRQLRDIEFRDCDISKEV